MEEIRSKGRLPRVLVLLDSDVGTGSKHLSFHAAICHSRRCITRNLPSHLDMCTSHETK